MSIYFVSIEFLRIHLIGLGGVADFVLLCKIDSTTIIQYYLMMKVMLRKDYLVVHFCTKFHINWIKIEGVTEGQRKGNYHPHQVLKPFGI